VADLFARGAPSVIEDVATTVECDVAIVGSGMGGATMAWALRETGARVLVIEQGDFLPREWQNWSPPAVHQEHRYKNSAVWVDGAGRPFVPGSYHYVGGSTKFYGATLPRMRVSDFEARPHHDGTSPAWPISYADLEPYYGQAERLYLVHGHEEDPTEPWRSSPFPFPPVPHEPPIARLAQRLRRQGLHPFSLPQAVDSRPGGRCVLCRTCDSYPCLVDAKGDADLCAMRPALNSPTVRLLTRAEVRSLNLASDGATVESLSVMRDGQALTVHPERVVVAAGAVNTAALLLRSRTTAHPAGVANGSGMVGRNYMAHTCSFVVGVRPGRDPQIVFQKTIGVNDWYEAGPDNQFPLGNVQALGKLTGPTIKAARRWVPVAVLDWFTRRSVDLFVETEDLPRRDNRVTVDPDGRIRLTWRPTNVEPHRELVRRLGWALRRAGYPLIFKQMLGVEATSHQCGTAVMGDDPRTSVVDRDCRAHDVANLWVADTSVFPSSAAVNPALTAAAIVLRIADAGAIAS
jgi:choline dehydrogenase-like flavoprotein